jgi:hypothetical protein
VAEADLVVAWYHGAIPASVHSAFERPTKFVNLPNPDNWGQALAGFNFASPAQSIADKYAPGTKVLRVAYLGFSASCQGVAQALASGDGGKIDAVLAIDGLHVGYQDGKRVNGPNPLSMKPWMEFAKRAVANITLFVDTHSSVVPPAYASTTETANYLWNQLTNASPAAAVPQVPDLSIPPTSVTTSVNGPTRTVDYPAPQWQPPKRFAGFVILGCNDLDPTGTTDHVYQGKYVLPLAITQFLAARWNAMDPHNLSASKYVG